LERDRLVKEDPIFARFLLKTPPDGRTVYLICTSAGEVGIDISGDCMVSDLTSLDSMTQRLGRVNRRGDGAAEIDVIYEAEADSKQKDNEWEKSRWKTLEVLQRLPICDWIEGRHDVSPAALLNLNLNDKERTAAFAPEPTSLPVTDILFDAWALTSIRDALPGRPPVATYLHGISEWQPPETLVAWREEVDIIKGELLQRYKPKDLLDDYPLKPHELLKDNTDRKGSGVFAQLDKLSAIFPNAPVWIVDTENEVLSMTLKEMIERGPDQLYDATVILPPKVGGLSRTGTLDGKAKPDEPIQHDVSDLWFVDKEQTQRGRIRVWDDDPEFEEKTRGMRLARSPVDTNPTADETENGEAPARRYWHWFARPRSADDDLSKTSTTAVKWQKHTDEVTENTQKIVEALNLPSKLQEALVIAAKFHDLGKRRKVWQRSIGNPVPDDWHAKSGRDWKSCDICPDYRHEFGSLIDVERIEECKAVLNKLGSGERDLVLHLIAAHHGRARPYFPIEEAFDPDSTPVGSEVIATEIPRRFARLQQQFGRWGLAYLESLLRAADYAASAGISPTKNITT
jgi:CRISPR-associated endonuclease/helicase Cas3